MIFLSDRTDGFGARLMGMINAMYMANAFNVPFKFTWRERGAKSAESHAIRSANTTFSKEYLEEHLISEEVLGGFTIIEEREFLGLPNPSSVVNAPDLAVRVTHSGIESRNAALKKRNIGSVNYRRCYESIIYTDSLQDAKYKGGSIQLPNRVIAIHLRAGDIVYGNFRFSDRFSSKVLTAPLAEKLALIEKKNGREVIFFGQDESLQRYLKEKTGAQLASDFFVEYGFDNEQQAVFEIELMSRCETIYGGASNFCIFPALIGNSDRIDPKSLFSPLYAVDCVRSFVESSKVKEINPLQVAFMCRAACIAGDQLIPVEDDFVKLMILAKELDPNNFFYGMIIAGSNYLRGECDAAEKIIADECLKLKSGDRHILLALTDPTERRSSEIRKDIISLFIEFGAKGNAFSALMAAVAENARGNKCSAYKFVDIFYEKCPPDLKFNGEVIISLCNLPNR